MKKTVICGISPSENFSFEKKDFSLSKGDHPLDISREELKRNLLFLGSPGTGKTNAINNLLASILQNKKENESLIIFDSKGDFYQSFYDENKNHILIGNDYENSYYWNIYKEIMDFDENCICYDPKREILAREISKMLFDGKESENQPFFHNAAADIVSKVILHFLRQASLSQDTSKLNNYYLANFLQRTTYKDLLSILEDPANPDFLGARDYIRGDDGQSQGVLSFIKEMASDLLVGVFGGFRGKDYEKKQFSIRDMVKNGKSDLLFIEYDIAGAKALGGIYKLLIDLAIKFSLSGREEDRRKNYLILDELSLLPRLNYLDDALVFGRSMELKIIAGIQSVDLMVDKYGEARSNVILSNFMNIITFYLSDYKSRDFMKKYFGNNYVNYSFNIGHTTINVQKVAYVFEEWDLMSLKKGQAIVKIVEKDPFLHKFSLYKKEENL